MILNAIYLFNTLQNTIGRVMMNIYLIDIFITR